MSDWADEQASIIGDRWAMQLPDKHVISENDWRRLDAALSAALRTVRAEARREAFEEAAKHGVDAIAVVLAAEKYRAIAFYRTTHDLEHRCNPACHRHVELWAAESMALSKMSDALAVYYGRAALAAPAASPAPEAEAK